MSQLKMLDNGDIDIVNNNFEIVKNSQEIRQRILQNLKTFLGEWFLDNQIGVPYFQIIFDRGASVTMIEDAIKDAILKTEGIVELIKFEPLDLDRTTRALSVDFEAKDEFGEILNITESIP